ncbi:hypothetical protein NUW58_g1739 [Xylaria curta]|uniref:Uncharacterized protein n=1 Tax=Xylaria curta TaxID=42375 RepID=A0ACC1PM38_9PEZI|nr:hypothetical protein NUW58_g1739 [Xylaria curta]
MAVPGTIQALIAAFSFGILFNAASAALVIYVKSHGSAIYRDGLRLVLILFLLTSSSWALVEFLATLIDPSAPSTCQVAVVFSSLFDQTGRFFAEQYLAWALPKGDIKTVFSLVPQILIVGRFFVGIAFTAVTRTQFNPTCAPISSIRAVSITTIVLDAVIIGLLSIQAFSTAMTGKSPDSHSTTPKTKTIRIVVVGIATSVTSLLGLESIDLFYKTALPGIGLTVLVALVTILSQTLAVPRALPQRPDSPTQQGARDLSSSDSADYPPSRYEDLKEANMLSMPVFAMKTETNRSIRRNEDGTFPTISKPVAVGSNVNGDLAQENLLLVNNSSDLAPVLSKVPPLPESWGIIKNPGSRMKIVSKLKTKPGGLTISNPILNEDENTENTLKRIHAVDLAEAANNDKQRREKYAQRIPNLVAQRPAPRPPSPPTAPDTVTMELKMAAELERSESTKTSTTSGGLSVKVNASSTGTQLSPGADVIRRRSPRHPEPASLATPFKVIKPGEPIRIPIPRPPQQTPEQPTKPEPVKTPLQRRPTTGLPSNPRAQTLKSLTKEAGNQKTQTVMFVNNIVYNNPDAIGDIIQGATKAPQPPDSGDTVVNRPRPIPRKGDKDRQVFPAESSSHNQHRRTKSGGSIISRKSILQSVPSSPTGLPSLPPIPPMAIATTRPMPNSTKSMTVEEKMSFLYAASLGTPSRTESSRKRRSSVPNLPSIPIVFREDIQPPTKDFFDLDSDSDDVRASKASKTTTTRTSTLLRVTAAPQNVGQNKDLVVSVDNRSPVDELEVSLLPETASDVRGEDPEVPGEVKRRSSPVLPLGRQLSMLTIRSEARSGTEETETNWGSVHSPIAPVSRQNARSTYIRKIPRNIPETEEIPIIMFDESFKGVGNASMLSDSERNKSPGGDSRASQRLSGQFHHRVGDNCPTFSARKDKPRPRKMPPPTPLLLNDNATKRVIVVQPAEPSPMESPRAAYETIQAQLRKFEQLDQDSVESPGQRLALLANLEQEMGQLETEWQSNHEHLSRDSISSIRTSSQHSRPTTLVPTLSRPSSQRSSFASAIAERRASRRARMRSGANEEILAPSSQNSSRRSWNDQGTARQTILAEPQLHNIDNAPELLARQDNLNFLSISKATLGSPSPPATDESDGELEETRGASHIQTTQPNAHGHGLWSQRATSRKSSSSWLWSPPIKVAKEDDQICELPGLPIRPTTRTHLGQLTIESSSLWQIDSKPIPVKLQEGLWDSHLFQRSESVKASSRPVTMRPPRKNKRVTLLPDIIENPEPLPNKRDTLGIFQFPWGEKSEHATLQYRPNQVFMAMPGTMTTGRPTVNPVIEARVTQLQATEYSSSFFDEYDEEEEGDYFSDFSESGDDDFDETTLWEIASLLRTDQIPSKNSLLPMPYPSTDASVLAEYDAVMQPDNERGNGDMAEISVSFEELETSDVSGPPSLWTPHHTSRPHVQTHGLPQDESFDWDGDVVEPKKRIRAWSSAENSKIPPGTKLWSPKVTLTSKASFLWSASELTKERQEPSYPIQPVQTLGLWMKPVTIASLFTLGLPEPETQAWQDSVVQTRVMKRSKSRVENSLLSISSFSLWTESRATKTTISWTQQAQYSTTGIWKPNGGSLRVIEPELTPAPATEDAPSSGLWEQPAQVRLPKSLGLFDPETARHDFRRTSKPPAAIASLKPRFAKEQALTLTSHNLWAPQRMQAILIHDEKINLLWQRKLSANIKTPTLFQLDTERTDYRTTSANPAALVMTRKPRTVEQPLQRLQSTQLWAKNRVTSMNLNWIAMCTPQPTSLPQSSLSPGGSADAKVSAITISATTTSSKDKAGFFSSWFGKKASRNATTKAAPGASHETTSNPGYPELSQGIVVKNLDNVPNAQPTRVVLRHRHQRPVVYNADWDAALAETIAASYRGTMVALRASYPQDWDDQLYEAIIASRAVSRIQNRDSTIISASSSTPSLWTKPLESRTALTNGLWTLSSELGPSSRPIVLYTKNNGRTYHYPMRGNNTVHRPEIEIDVPLRKQELWKHESGDNRLRHHSLQKNWLRMELR